MGVQKRIPWLSSLGVVLAAVALLGSRAGADVTSDRPGSIVIWPKVIADGTRDTLITLTNTNTMPVDALCEYILGTGTCQFTSQYCSTNADCPQPGGLPNPCNVTWATVDFPLTLTAQQPTIWRVSTGREENLFLPDNGRCVTTVVGNPPTRKQSCPGLLPDPVKAPPFAGLLDPPDNPLAPQFRGELRCIEVDASGKAIAMNSLKGEAIIETLGSDQISEYNAINVRGGTVPGPSAASPEVLKLNGIEYNACPDAIEATHYANGQHDIVAAGLGAPCGAGGCPVQTEITVTPCRSQFLAPPNYDLLGTRFNLNVQFIDEFESQFSTGGPYDCWLNANLTQLRYSNINSSIFLHSVLSSAGDGFCIRGTLAGTLGCTMDSDCGSGGVCAPPSGLLAVFEQFHSTTNSPAYPTALASNQPASDAVNANARNPILPVAAANDDPSTLQRPGHCRNDLTTQCTKDSDCTKGGWCRLNATAQCDNDGDCNGPITGQMGCTGNQTPHRCCTGTNTGTCNPSDFCDKCMNDEVIYPIIAQ